MRGLSALRGKERERERYTYPVVSAQGECWAAERCQRGGGGVGELDVDEHGVGYWKSRAVGWEDGWGPAYLGRGNAQAREINGRERVWDILWVLYD